MPHRACVIDAPFAADLDVMRTFSLGRGAGVIANAKSWLARAGGVIVAAVPFVLAIASLLSRATYGWPKAALPMAAAGMFLGGANAYSSWVRPLLHRLREGSLRGYKFASGIPLFGTLLAIGSVLTAYGAQGVAGVAVITLLLDTGGVPWLVVATWRDEGFWSSIGQ